MTSPYVRHRLPCASREAEEGGILAPNAAPTSPVIARIRNQALVVNLGARASRPQAGRRPATWQSGRDARAPRRRPFAGGRDARAPGVPASRNQTLVGGKIFVVSSRTSQGRDS